MKFETLLFKGSMYSVTYKDVRAESLKRRLEKEVTPVQLNLVAEIGAESSGRVPIYPDASHISHSA